MPEPNPLVVSKEIEKDMRDMFYAIDSSPLNLRDKFGAFRFYLSGLKSGHEIIMKSAELTLKIPLIESIYRTYGDYDEGIITRDVAWKQMTELLS